MRDTQLIMGMPITVITPDTKVNKANIRTLFDFFHRIDEIYSPYRTTSDVSKINDGSLDGADYSDELRLILRLAEKTKRETKGYFDVWHQDVFDPSGIVKGWAIGEAAKLFASYTNDFYIEAGGDIQVHGVNEHGSPWHIGVRSPFNRTENIAVVSLVDRAIATSGTAIRGQHIYDPVTQKPLDTVCSMTVIAPSIIDADRMATAAFAMGENGIYFLESLNGYEGCMITKDKKMTTTTGWKEYEVKI